MTDFLECHLINQYFVLPLLGTESSSAPREEIADPELIMYLIDHMDSITWDIYEVNEEHSMYRTWIPCHRKWRTQHGIVSASGVYILTESPSMFRNFYPGNEFRKQWVEKYWNTLFLITVPVVTFRKHGDVMSHPYSIGTQYPMTAASYPSMFYTNTLAHLLQYRSYTIANGLTILLAAHRNGMLDSVDTSGFVQHVLDMDPLLFQNVPDSWSDLYYGHTSPHIADFPWIYTIMGREVAGKTVRDLLKPDDDTPIPIMNTGNGLLTPVQVFTTTATALLPHMKYGMMKELEIDWPGPPFPMDEDDQLTPDIYGLIMGITRSKTVWDRWWMPKKEAMFERFEQCIGNTRDCLRYWLVACFRLYMNAKSHRPRLCYSRIRALWMQVLAYYDPAYLRVRKMLHGWIIKQTVMHHIRMPFRETFVPYAFLKDLVEHGAERIQIHRVRTQRIHSNMFLNDIAQLWPEDCEIDAEKNEITVQRSCIKSMSEAPVGSIPRIFYEKYLVPKITQRLCVVQNAFVMRGEDESPWYTVGKMMMYWYQDHKEELLRS